MSTKSGGQQMATQNSSMAAKIRSLEILNEAISRHQAHLETLCAERDQLERELEAFQSMNPAVHRLPVEVLTEIFKEVIEYKDSIVRSIPVANHGRITLAQVCKAWRNIVNSTPTLWRIIHLKVPHWSENYFRWAEKMDCYLDQCLARSGDTGLHVLMGLTHATLGALYTSLNVKRVLAGPSGRFSRIQLPNGVDWDQFPTSKEYGNKLKRLIKRIVSEEGEKMKSWHRLYLFMPEDEDVVSMIWPLLNYPAFQLQDLQLGRMRWWWEEPSSPLPRFLSFPSLRTLQVYIAPLKVVTSCPQLRQLIITVLFPEEDWDNLRFLASFPLLEELRFRTFGWNSGMDDSELLTVQIPFLKHLHLDGRPPAQIVQALDIAKISRLTIEEPEDFARGYPEAPLLAGAQYVRLVLKSQTANIKTLLQTLFPQLSSTHTIEVPDMSFDVAQQIVEYEKGRGNLRSLCRLVANKMDGGIMETIYPID